MKIKVGDIVKITHEGLDHGALTPGRLVQNGHLNRFHVVTATVWDRAVYPEGTISLLECCKNPKEQCTGHPAEYFEVISNEIGGS